MPASKRSNKQAIIEQMKMVSESMINTMKESDRAWMEYEERREQREQEHEFKILSMLLHQNQPHQSFTHHNQQPPFNSQQSYNNQQPYNNW